LGHINLDTNLEPFRVFVPNAFVNNINRSSYQPPHTTSATMGFTDLLTDAGLTGKFKEFSRAR
jgi:hypothetical protein